jgi:hypothetical protein
MNYMLCNDGSPAVNMMMPQGWPLVCRNDIYKAYLNYNLCVLQLTKVAAIDKREFYKLLRNHLDKYQCVKAVKFPDDYYYRGVCINNGLRPFPPQLPQTGNWGKQKMLPQ